MKTRIRVWLLKFLGVEALLGAESIRRETDLAVIYSELASHQKQIEALRRLAVVQEKPKVRAQAASFREVRQFIGDDDD